MASAAAGGGMYRRGGGRQGRGSAAAAAVVCLLLLIISSESTAVQAAGGAVHTIDWGFSPKIINPLASGKTIRAGDKFRFKYSPGYHNVVEVDKATYDGCGAPTKANKVYVSGAADNITLTTKGQHYFICSVPGHCKAGMKITIFAA